MIGYPYSYRDRLTPKMARNNRKRAVSYSVLIPTIWWHNLGFGEPIQSYSSGGKSQPEISGVLKQKSPSMRAQPEQVLKASLQSLSMDHGLRRNQEISISLKHPQAKLDDTRFTRYQRPGESKSSKSMETLS